MKSPTQVICPNSSVVKDTPYFSSTATTIVICANESPPLDIGCRRLFRDRAALFAEDFNKNGANLFQLDFHCSVVSRERRGS